MPGKGEAAMKKLLTFWNDLFGKAEAKKKTVLIIDDSELDRRLYTGILGKRYKVLESATGRGGLTMAKDQQPDMVLLDFELPDLKGPEVCRILKFDEATKNIPIIILTAYDMPANVVDTFDCGADMYLSKPIRSGELLRQAEQVMEVAVAS